MDIPIINIFCYKLPYDISNKIYNEFDSRFRDAKYMIDNYDYYKPLKQHLKAIEIILAMSIFYKRIITNLDSAVKFHGNVMTKSHAEIISIGSYELDTKEKNRIQAILINFQKIIEKYRIPQNIFDYYETKEFLRHIKEYLTDISPVSTD